MTARAAATTVTAAVVREVGGPFRLEALELTGPQPDEVVVRMRAVGICHTDIGVQHGHIPVALPAVLGHEGAGEVEQVGSDVTSVRVGDRVLLSQAFCFHCDRCRAGQPAYCLNAPALSLGGRREDGSATLHSSEGPVSGNFVGQSSFATHALVKARNVYRVGDDAPLDVLAPLGCGVMTGAGAVFNDLALEPGSSVAVFGCGTVGLSAVMAARIAEAAVVVAVDPMAARRELALDLGATHVVDPAADAVKEIHALSGGGVDGAVEAAGSAAAAAAAIGSTHSLGRTVVVGAAPFGTTLAVDWWTLAAGRSLRGSVVGSSDPGHDLPRLLDLWGAGRFPVERLVTRFAFTEINDAVAAAASGRAVKPVLVFDE